MNPIVLWRLSCAAHKKKIPLVPRLLKTLIFLVYKAILPCEAVVGPGLSLEHYGLGIVVHPNVTIGSNVRIYPASGPRPSIPTATPKTGSAARPSGDTPNAAP